MGKLNYAVIDIKGRDITKNAIIHGNRIYSNHRDFENGIGFEFNVELINGRLFFMELA